MGMTNNQLALARAVAENRFDDARRIAIACLAEDFTKKNAREREYLMNVLKNGPAERLELPMNLKGLAVLENMKDFRADRHFLPEGERKLLERIRAVDATATRLDELGIKRLNSVLLHGKSGTGKTTFGKRIAYELGIPFLYVNFSGIVDSLMGRTARNLKEVFSFAKRTRCLFMLDEIDVVAGRRTNSSDGAAREWTNCVATILQELDEVGNGPIVVGATNMLENVDPAVRRRFAIEHEFRPPTDKETFMTARKYLETVPFRYDEDELGEWARKSANAERPQSEVIGGIVDAIVESLTNGSDELKFS